MEIIACDNEIGNWEHGQFGLLGFQQLQKMNVQSPAHMYAPRQITLHCCPFKGEYSDADHSCCTSNIVVTRYTLVHFAFCFHVVTQAL